MRRLSIVIGVLVTAAATACLGSVSAPTEKAIPYAVIYGRIGAPALTFNITVDFSAYKDSAAAVHDSSAAFAGSFAQGVDTGNLYQAVVPAAAPATYFINIFATGQGTHGFVSSVDTFRALRVRFDSIGGGPHDSIEVDDSLPQTSDSDQHKPQGSNLLLEVPVPKYVIEREIPGAGKLSDKDIRDVSASSNKILHDMASEGKDVQWIESYVTGDKLFCVYKAPDAETIREHARRGGFPANAIHQVTRVIDPTTGEAPA